MSNAINRYHGQNSNPGNVCYQYKYVLKQVITVPTIICSISAFIMIITNSLLNKLIYTYILAYNNAYIHIYIHT